MLRDLSELTRIDKVSRGRMLILISVPAIDHIELSMLQHRR
jgi:hypothetical protein